MQFPVVLVGNDTDLLVMLIHGSKTKNVYMQFGKDSAYNVHSIVQNLKSSVSRHILIAHAISGCDTVSALYGVGGKKGNSRVGKRGMGNIRCFSKK